MTRKFNDGILAHDDDIECMHLFTWHGFPQSSIIISLTNNGEQPPSKINVLQHGLDWFRHSFVFF